MNLGPDFAVSDDLRDIVEAPLESTHPTNSNVVLGCATFVLVLDGGVLAKYVAISDSIDLVARVTVLVFVFVEPEGKGALRILLLHPLSCKRNTEKRSQKATDMVGRVVAVDMTHEGWPCQLLKDSFTPLDDGILDSMLLQNPKDILGDFVGDVRGGGTRRNANPYDDRTKSPLFFLSRWSMGEESSRVNGRPVDVSGLDVVTDLGTHGIPDVVEWSVVNSTKRLDRNVSESASGFGEGRRKV